MLVQNRRRLETRCPFWWTAGAATAAIALVLIAATFGEASNTHAADDRAPGVGKVPAAPKLQTGMKRKSDGDKAAPARAKPADAISDADQERILAHLGSRA